MRRMIRLVGLVALMAVFATAAYAATAENTVPDTYAGIGEGAISGYVVSDIHYYPQTSIKGNLYRMTFKLDHPAETVLIWFDGVSGAAGSAGAQTPPSCHHQPYSPDPAGTAWECSFTGNPTWQVPIKDITKLHVSASS